MKDLVNRVHNLRAFAATVVQASAQGPAVPVQFAESAMFAIDLGTLGDTLSAAKSYEFRVQESQDGATGWADVTNPNYVQYGPLVLASGTAADPAQTLKLGYLGYAPFIRLSIVVTGTMTTGTTIAAQAVLGNYRHQPAGVSQQTP
jgi:hypothetical protein